MLQTLCDTLADLLRIPGGLLREALLLVPLSIARILFLLVPTCVAAIVLLQPKSAVTGPLNPGGREISLRPYIFVVLALTFIIYLLF